MNSEDISVIVSASIDRAIVALKSQKLMNALYQKEYSRARGNSRIDPPLSLEEQKELQQLEKRLDNRYTQLGM